MSIFKAEMQNLSGLGSQACTGAWQLLHHSAFQTRCGSTQKDDEKAGLSLFLPWNHSPEPWQPCPHPSIAQTATAGLAQIGGYFTFSFCRKAPRPPDCTENKAAQI